MSEGEKKDSFARTLFLYEKENIEIVLKGVQLKNTTLQLFHKKNIVQDFLMYNEFDPKHYKGK